VSDLASKVEALLAIPADQLRFKWNGVSLSDVPEKKLSEIGVSSGDTIVIVVEATSPGRSCLLKTPPPSPFKQKSRAPSSSPYRDPSCLNGRNAPPK
jgi:hypothetical protein